MVIVSILKYLLNSQHEKIQMKKISIIALAALLMASCGDKTGSKVAMKTVNDSFSYAFGAAVGSFMLKQNNVKEINWEIFKNALEKSMVSGDSGLAMNRETINKVIENYFNQSKYGENIKKGKDYLEKNLKNGYTKSSTGLLFKKTKGGNGVKPNITDTILVIYTGKFIDGTVFNTNEGDKPVKFALNGGAIPGFSEALSMMEEGSEYDIIIPYDLAYGVKGRQNPYSGEYDIKPYETLCFNIKLISIQK